MAFVTPLSSTSFLSSRSPTRCARKPKQAAGVTMAVAQSVPDVLAKILDRKQEEVALLKAYLEVNPWDPIANVLQNRGRHTRSKAFYNALNLPKGDLTVIAEIKRKSPSKGHIGGINDPQELAEVYYQGGAGAISVLTDFEGFGGSIGDLRSVVRHQQANLHRTPGPCPILRKDFVIDEVQIAEAAAAGASAVLLIVAALGEKRTRELLIAAHEMGLDALVEVHDEYEVEEAVRAGAEIIGVNNRDLRKFNVSLDTSFRLASMIPDDKIKVAESGIERPVDAWRLRDAGFSAVLVGETLVRAHERSFRLVEFSEATQFIKAYKAKCEIWEICN